MGDTQNLSSKEFAGKNRKKLDNYNIVSWYSSSGLDKISIFYPVSTVVYSYKT